VVSDETCKYYEKVGDEFEVIYEERDDAIKDLVEQCAQNRNTLATLKVTKSMPISLVELDQDEDESELALASTISMDEPVALPEVNNNDAIFATIAFPAIAVILGAMCWNQRKAFRK
jgi:hypothetical protein